MSKMLSLPSRSLQFNRGDKCKTDFYVTKRLDFNCSHHKKEMTMMYCDVMW